MGRVLGFFAGLGLVSLGHTYALAYVKKSEPLVSLSLQHARARIEDRILSDRGLHAKVEPVNKRVEFTSRPSVRETCRDIWNDEIIKMVNWVYSINWYQWGLDADRGVNKLADGLALLAKK